MRKILSLLLFVCIGAFAQTKTPIQLINPIGSTSGQVITSTGASSAPTWANPSAAQYIATLGISGALSQGAFAYGTLSYSDTNLFSSFQCNVNGYCQSVLQNTNAGATASSDFVVSNNLSTASTYYGNFGMNSSGFTGAGSFNLPNAVYLTSTTGDLVVGTTTSNAIHFAVNGGADAGAFSTAGVLSLATPLPVVSGGTGVSSSTGTGSAVLSTSPVLVTPALGTPSSGVATNLTGTATALNIGGNAATSTLASNIASGAANSIPYQTGAGATSFLAQGTGVLQESAGAPLFTLTPTLTGTNFSGNAASLTVGTATNQTGGTVSATTLTASSTITLSPASANVAISPTGTGTVTINPATASSINNETLGLTTPLAAKVTTLTATGLITPAYPSGILGNISGGTVTAGSIGEYLTATGTGVAVTTATATNITSLSLTAGMWDVSGSTYFLAASGTAVTGINAGISTTTATLPATPLYSSLNAAFNASSGQTLPLPAQRILISSTTTYYCVAFVVFTVSTESVTCIINAERR